jgi:hypothetical protein
VTFSSATRFRLRSFWEGRADAPPASEEKRRG